MTIPLDTIKMLAPVVHFHADENYFPCSIEHILTGGVLQDISPAVISGQKTSIPAVCVFNNMLWMIYSSDSGPQLYSSFSTDGLHWSDAVEIANQSASTPAVCEFGGALWMAYSNVPNEHISGEIVVTNTRDGINWSAPQGINQSTSVPAMVSFNGLLWLIYSDSSGSEIYVTSSTDGLNWENTHTIGQSTSIPSAAVFNGEIWLAYSDSDNSNIWVTSSPDGNNWHNTHQIGQQTSIPALVTFNNQLWMIYSDSNSSTMYVTSSTDGMSWTAASVISNQFTSVPAAATFNNSICMVYSDAHSAQLWATRSADGIIWTRPDIQNLTQQALADNFDGSYTIQIAEAQYPGEGLRAPMYYATQEFPTYKEITYIFLFAYNGHQTAESGFYCIIDNFARHPGDIERLTVRFDDSSGSPVILQVCFEAHGDPDVVLAKDLTFSGTHVLAYCALNGHGTFNYTGGPRWVIDRNFVVVTFGNALGIKGSDKQSDLTWAPSDYRLVGLDASGAPIGSEVWAKFRGRIGQHVKNSLNGARYFNGSGLSGNDWAKVKILGDTAGFVGLISEELSSGDGPEGLATRPYIKAV